MNKNYAAIEKKVTAYGTVQGAKKEKLEKQISEAEKKISETNTALVAAIENGTDDEYIGLSETKQRAEYSLELAQKRLDLLKADPTDVSKVYEEIATVQNKLSADAKKKFIDLLGQMEDICTELSADLQEGTELADRWHSLADPNGTRAGAVLDPDMSIISYFNNSVKRGSFFTLMGR